MLKENFNDIYPHVKVFVIIQKISYFKLTPCKFTLRTKYTF